jgi:hypothetical protein
VVKIKRRSKRLMSGLLNAVPGGRTRRGLRVIGRGLVTVSRALRKIRGFSGQ